MKQKNIFTRKFWELTGCVHSHTEYSYDSVAPIPKIIDAARNSNLDYFTINDHRTKEASKDPAIISEKDIFTIIGVEVNDIDNNNHTLVFNSDRIIIDAKAEYYTKEYQNENAVTFAAHPIEKRISKEFRTFEWTDLENTKFNGLEIWNFMSHWIGMVNPKWNGIFMIMAPSLRISRPNKALIQYWDNLNKKGLRKSAIGSVDAHGQEYKFLGVNLKFLGHKYLFNTLRTNVLIDETKELSDKTIVQALADGNSYIINYKLGDPYNFFAGISDKKDSAIFGEEIIWTKEMKYYYRLPKICKIKLFCDGKIVAKDNNEKGYFKIEKPGNYRIEVYRYGKGWIYSNNIYVVK